MPFDNILSIPRKHYPTAIFIKHGFTLEMLNIIAKSGELCELVTNTRRQTEHRQADESKITVHKWKPTTSFVGNDDAIVIKLSAEDYQRYELLMHNNISVEALTVDAFVLEDNYYIKVSSQFLRAVEHLNKFYDRRDATTSILFQEDLHRFSDAWSLCIKLAYLTDVKFIMHREKPYLPMLYSDGRVRVLIGDSLSKQPTLLPTLVQNNITKEPAKSGEPNSVIYFPKYSPMDNQHENPYSLRNQLDSQVRQKLVKQPIHEEKSEGLDLTPHSAAFFKMQQRAGISGSANRPLGPPPGKAKRCVR